jgi:hypothetical protein
MILPDAFCGEVVLLTPTSLILAEADYSKYWSYKNESSVNLGAGAEMGPRGSLAMRISRSFVAS